MIDTSTASTLDGHLQERNSNELPDWIFDVDSDDEYDSNSSLLQELEIDSGLMYRNIIWTLIGPCSRMLGKRCERHPLHKSNSIINSAPVYGGNNLTNNNLSNNNHSSPNAIDFGGPCAIVSTYGLLLWLGRVKDVPWIYVIWSIAGIFNHIVTRVWCHSTLLIHVALLGYSITPIIPFAALILLFNPPVWLATILEIISVIWSSSSAIQSYLFIFRLSQENKSKIKLLFPVIILMEIYFISLLPIHHKAIISHSSHSHHNHHHHNRDGSSTPSLMPSTLR
eukprot:gene6678-9162_t